MGSDFWNIIIIQATNSKLMQSDDQRPFKSKFHKNSSSPVAISHNLGFSKSLIISNSFLREKNKSPELP